MGDRVRVVPSEIQDIYRLSANLRDDDRAEVEALAGSSRRLFRENFRGAFVRQTAFVDGEIAAMWGLYGNALSHIGSPYLLTAAAVERVPRDVVREGRKAVAVMLSICPRLEGHVAAGYGRACRFVECLGFTLGEPVPFGARGVMFRPFHLTRGG